MSVAEILAYQRATQKGEGGQALEGDKLAEAQAKEKAGKDIDDARKAEKITVNDGQQMMLAPYKHPTRLAATVARLILDDALDVYAAAGVQEKRDIRAEVTKKSAPTMHRSAARSSTRRWSRPSSSSL